MHAAWQFLLVLALARAVAAASGGGEPASPPSGGSWAPCLIEDQECLCAAGLGPLQYYCGFVDPAWASEAGSARRDLEGESEPEALNATHEARTAAASTQLQYSRIYPRGTYGPEIVYVYRNPMERIIEMIGISALIQGVMNIVPNRFPPTATGRWVTGVRGELPYAVRINGRRYSRGSAFEIRWDWNAVNSESAIAQGRNGAHVNFQVRELMGGLSQSWAIFDEALSGPAAGTFPAYHGNTYYHNVIQVQNDVTGYDSNTRTLDRDAQAAAQALVQRWIDSLYHDELKA
ncbi:MAG: hypothetical protein M1817_000072 [Caeruleum heppii]|nr:MAG: hypothetical protein M1817_000072 [Caeruleum heppii]